MKGREEVGGCVDVALDVAYSRVRRVERERRDGQRTSGWRRGRLIIREDRGISFFIRSYFF